MMRNPTIRMHEKELINELILPKRVFIFNVGSKSWLSVVVFCIHSFVDLQFVWVIRLSYYIDSIIVLSILLSVREPWSVNRQTVAAAEASQIHVHRNICPFVGSKQICNVCISVTYRYYFICACSVCLKTAEQKKIDFLLRSVI